MNEEQKFKLKALFWDQFIRPFKTYVNLSQLNILLTGILILVVIVFRSMWLFLFIAGIQLCLFFYELYKYYKSGEYINNYRKHKYGDYKNTIKKIKQEKKDLNSLNNLNNDDREEGTREVSEESL